MDHKVSKDMISSGMIPSGEKTQADLGRTQYGSAPSPSKLMDAYKSMYGNKEEVINEHHKKDADGNTIPHEDEELNEFVVTGTMAALKGLGAMATKLGTAAAKTGVKVGAKLGGKTGANLMKSVARNPMGAIDNINRVGYAAQTVGNLIPKPSVPAVTKKQSQGGMISADADLFDIVKGKLLDEGYNEREVNEIMVNLTEEQLDEFLKALAQAGMRGAESVGKATRGLAAQAAQQGANIGKKPSEKIDVLRTKRKPFDPKPKERKPFDPKPKPGDSDFRAKTASDVISAANATRAARAKNLRDKMDAAAASMKSGSSPFGSTSKEQPKAKDNTVGVYGGGKVTNSKGQGNKFRGPENRKAKEEEIKKQREALKNGADLFDIVKGQLLDEGMSEEDIKDIMLTLTPDEILNELSGDLMKRAAKGAESARQIAARAGDTELAKKRLAQSQKFSSAMKSKNLEKQSREANRKPTQYDSPLTKPVPDYSKPYPGTPR